MERRRPTGGETPDDASACDGRVDDGDDIFELGLVRRVEATAGVQGDKTIAVGELGEHADVVAVLELDACEMYSQCQCDAVWPSGCSRVAIVVVVVFVVAVLSRGRDIYPIHLRAYVIAESPPPPPSESERCDLDSAWFAAEASSGDGPRRAPA